MQMRKGHTMSKVTDNDINDINNNNNNNKGIFIVLLHEVSQHFTTN